MHYVVRCVKILREFCCSHLEGWNLSSFLWDLFCRYIPFTLCCSHLHCSWAFSRLFWFSSRMNVMDVFHSFLYFSFSSRVSHLFPGWKQLFRQNFPINETFSENGDLTNNSNIFREPLQQCKWFLLFWSSNKTGYDNGFLDLFCIGTYVVKIVFGNQSFDTIY